MAALRQSEAEPHADSLWNNAVTRAIRDNPALAAVLLGGVAAVTGPQMIAALQKIGGNRALEFARRLEPHAAEATKAWEMVGGSGPTKLRYLGGGVDAQAFGVRPGGVILKMSRPETHLGFDPHRTAETAPRDVLLPVLEHGKFGTPGREVSWFVQPRAHLPGERRLARAIQRRTGQEPTPVGEAYDKLENLMRERGDPWDLIDTHAGNIGHWAGRDWVIDLGTMWPTGPRPPRVPAPPPPPPAPSPVSTPSTPPGWQPRVQPTSHPNRVWFADQPTSHLPGIARNFLDPNLKRRGEAIIEFSRRMRERPGRVGQLPWKTPTSLRALWSQLLAQARARGEPFL